MSVAQPAAAAPIGVSARLWMATLALLVVGGVVLAPMAARHLHGQLLIRAFFVAIAAVTVDIMWGYCGTLTFGQSAFFGIWCLCTCDRLYRIRFWVLAGLFLRWGGHHHLRSGSPPLRLALILSGFNSALRINRSLVLRSSSYRFFYSGGTFTDRPAGSSDSRHSICRSRTGFVWQALVSPPLPLSL